ncbi:MAG: hypothetical protein K0R75_3906, partial [Paenibacillaceae bacterium]|nr:hypothetical protein [Paenibacillaceae bacterium]
ARVDSKVMALLMHWEGTAPWAPPYVWPPYGSEDNFRKFADQLHQDGHLLGVYCSGIAWTNESLLEDYNRKQQFEEEHLAEVMCASPEGELRSIICNGAQRYGYDMCPTNEFVEQVVVQEVSHMLDSGCDYIQFFDQILGGLSCFCYSDKHGHPPVPGKWQNEAMIALYEKLQKLIDESGKKVLIGCEAAAAEPFIPDLLFNDMRFNINFFAGNPIPLYQYVYHEYINNFMGNQNPTRKCIDYEKSPDNLLWRTAYSFIAGDMLTVVLRDAGEINWDWGSHWTESKPNQDDILDLIHHLNAWRTGEAKPYLCFGRMEKPYELKTEAPVDIELLDRGRLKGAKLTNPPLLTSRWQSQEGKQAQMIVNYTTQAQKCSVRVDHLQETTVTVVETADGKQRAVYKVDATGEFSLRIEPLSAIMLQL